MDRLACVDVPALPLQLLLREHPDWRAQPVAVVEEDRPQGLIQWVNEAAWALGIRPGQRYAQGLALAAELRGGIVSPAAVAGEIEALTAALRNCTPHVEPYVDEPGVFWLDASGLGRLYPSLAAWAQAVRLVVAQARLQSVIVVGFRRFATFAVAKAVEAQVTIFEDESTEDATAARVPLDRVGLDHDVCLALAKLAVRTVGGFVRLPPAGVARRFGEKALRLRRLAAGELWDPLQPRAAVDPLESSLDLDDADADVDSLLFFFKRLLDPLLGKLASRGEELEEIVLRLDAREERLRPAVPTLDGVQLLGLVRLRLETLALSAGVKRIELVVRGVESAAAQLALFAAKARRDAEAAARAFARLRAVYGADAVVRARLREAHLPEAGLVWEPLDELVAPRPRKVERRPLVRRLLRPQSVPPPAESSRGPYVISGGWWRAEVQRDYYFVASDTGEWLWIYYDHRRRRWFLQGRVG